MNDEHPVSTDILELDGSAELAAGESQYLTFRLQEEEYGLDILQVQEIKNYTRITPIPNTPPYIKGAMNLRGTVVPIVDLRQRFNMPATEYSQYTVIIVVNIGGRVVGLIVDAVNDVLNVREEDCEPPPSLGSDVDVSFMSGLAKKEDRLITLLNIESLIDLEKLKPTAETAVA